MNGALGVHWDDLPQLRQRAVTFLTSGPARAPVVAEEIFGMRYGPSGLASCLVREVLAGDPRFEADHERWLLRDGSDGCAGYRLADLDYVVVDVEATGGSPARGDRLTEFAAVQVCGGKIVDTYESLINPQRSIPPSVTRLTDITDAMVADAPTFGEIADVVRETLEGAVFVAHNVSFDWRLLQSEFERCRGGRLGGERLCTLRMARRLHPELPRRNLHALADYYAITPERWHRAGSDARATAEIFVRFLNRLGDEGVANWGCLQAFLRGEFPDDGSGDGKAKKTAKAKKAAKAKVKKKPKRRVRKPAAAKKT
ncbi:MAG: exonuclease domain-containing protein [Gemmatimonadales bacterium]|jgi:DNA polymerase III epsilon subunit family exonuclease